VYTYIFSNSEFILVSYSHSSVVCAAPIFELINLEGSIYLESVCSTSMVNISNI